MMSISYQFIAQHENSVKQDLDDLDKRILNAVQADSRMPVGEIAAKVGASAPTCYRRLERLRAEKIIEREVALVSPQIDPRPLTVVVEITLERQTEALQRAFENKMRRSPAVTQCYMVSGHVDYLAIMRVSDVEEYHTMMRTLFTANENVRNFRSMFALKRSKFETAIGF